MPGWSQMPSTISRPPLTMLMTPGGMSHCSSSLNIARVESGTCSDGLTMMQLPVATAKGRNQSGTIAGKLNGVIAATTPSGWRKTVGVDVGRDLLEAVAHHQRRGAARDLDALDPAPHAAARLVDRLAVLGRDRPRDLLAVRSSSSTNRNIDRARTTTGVSRQAGKAFAAACTAASRSARVESGVFAITEPTAGLWTSTNSFACAGIHLPPT